MTVASTQITAPSVVASLLPLMLPWLLLPQAEQLLISGKAKYEGGDRMGALRLWEQALKEVRRVGSSWDCKGSL